MKNLRYDLVQCPVFSPSPSSSARTFDEIESHQTKSTPVRDTDGFHEISATDSLSPSIIRRLKPTKYFFPSLQHFATTMKTAMPMTTATILKDTKLVRN